MSSEAGSELTFAANNGAVGGGEVMLLEMATAAAEAGLRVSVVGPHAPGGVIDRALGSGLTAEALSPDRLAYLRELRRWDRSRRGLLWCNGLVPALATAGHPERVVHLHRMPEGPQRPAARLARLGTRAVVVPSAFMARALGAHELPNWCPGVEPRPDGGVGGGDAIRLGFLGRLGIDKGIVVLARAVERLVASGHAIELVIGGEPLFVDRRDQRVIGHELGAIAEHTRRIGWVPAADLFGQVDILVVPSVWREPFGLVLAEAMSAGLPCVVTDAGALPDIVGAGHPWIARAGSVESLTRTLEVALATSDKERRFVGGRGRRRWEECYSPSIGRARFLEFVDQTLAGGGRR